MEGRPTTSLPPASWRGGGLFRPTGECYGAPIVVAWGGQILHTPEVTETPPLLNQAILLDLGQHLLKNVSAPQQLYQWIHPQLLV